MWRRLIYPVAFLFLIAALFVMTWQQKAPAKQQRLLPTLRPGTEERILVFVPHPDDEVVGVGAFLAAAHGPRLVVFVTQGDRFWAAAHLEQAVHGNRQKPLLALGQQRYREAKDALNLLSPGARRLHLGYQDKSIDGLLGFPHAEERGLPKGITRLGAGRNLVPYRFTPHMAELESGENLYRDLVKLIEEFRPDVVLYPSPYDEHRDHRAVSALVSLALVAHARPIKAYQYLVHWPLWPTPPGFHPGTPLRPPRTLLHCGLRWLLIPTTREERGRMLLALAAHQSQLRVLSPYLLSFVRANGLLTITHPLTAGTTITEAGGSVTWGRSEAGSRVFARFPTAARPGGRVFLDILLVGRGRRLLAGRLPMPLQSTQDRTYGLTLPEELRAVPAIVRVVRLQPGLPPLMTHWCVLTQYSRRPSSARTKVISSA